MTMWGEKARQINPTGKSFRIIRNLVKPQIKNISLFQKPNQDYDSTHPVPPEGRIMIVTIVGTGRGGRW